MKIKFLSILALGTFAFVSCTDDSDYDKTNTAPGVTVEMKETMMRFSEDQASNTSFFFIPIVVNGEANGNIDVTVELASVGEDGAIEDTHYIMTSKQVTIVPGEQSVNLEFYPKGNDVINDDRSFNVTISNVKGASIGANSTCEVVLVDNEGMLPRAYAEIVGTYDCKLNSVFDGLNENEVTVVAREEGEEGYEEYMLTFVNLIGNCVWEGKMSVDGATGAPMVTFDFTQNPIEGNFNTQAGVAYLIGHPTYTNGSTGYYGLNQGSMTAYGDPDFKTLEFDFEGYPGMGILLTNNGSPYSWYESLTSISMVKK